ncbi:MAG: hypothetical protein GY863_15070 [bacterium]|nr:hypothetical protein [bacterium]
MKKKTKKTIKYLKRTTSTLNINRYSERNRQNLLQGKPDSDLFHGVNPTASGREHRIMDPFACASNVF